MRLSDLQHKDVVNMLDGKKIGNIIDVSIDNDGRMSGLIVEKNRFLISMFTNKNEIEYYKEKVIYFLKKLNHLWKFIEKAI